MSLQPGDKLGPYEIIAPIGAGGMGEVYKARDTRLDRTVAIKTSKVEFTERFEREAQAVAALNHPNICTLHDVCPTYLVMEFIDGQPIKGPRPIERILQYAAQICDALHAAHSKGITHRDLKPANILLTKQGIKLLDFGLAKRTELKPVNDETLTLALTGEGVILGTPQYMAPEQIEGRQADARSDIFALGCVLYEMVTGRKAFEGKSVSAVAAAILARDPDPIEPGSLQRVIQSCLAKDPDDRWQSARDVKLALAPVSDKTDAPKPSRRWQIAAVAASLLGLTAVTAIYLRPVPQAELIRFQISENVIDSATAETQAISPDGRKLAFFSNRADGRRQVFIRRLDSLKSTPVPGTEGAHSYFWSPDSNSLGFVLNTTLKKIELSSSTVTQLAEKADTFAIWTSKDIIVFAPITHSPLLQVPANGGDVTPATKLNPDLGETRHRNPSSCGPDGRFLYRASLKDGGIAWRIGSLAGRPPVTVQNASPIAACASLAGTRGYQHYLVDYRSGTLQARRLDLDTGTVSGPVAPIATGLELGELPFGSAGFFSTSETGVIAYRTLQGFNRSLAWFDRNGKLLRELPLGARGTNPALSRDGLRAAAYRDGAIWVIDLARETSMRLTPPDRGGYLPAWSADGNHIAYYSGDRILEIDSNGLSEPRTVAITPNWVQEYSPDGKSILFINTARMALQTVAVQGNQPPVDIAPPGPTYFPASFSPDGRFVAYSSSESGRLEIYVRAVPPATGKWLVSNNGGGMAAWRGDGRELFYLSPELDMMAVDTGLNPTFQPGTPRVLFKAKVSGNNNTRNHYVVAKDGQRFLIATDSGVQSPINVIVNWPALLNTAPTP